VKCQANNSSVRSDELEDLIPPRKRTRRGRLLDAMPDWKLERNLRNKGKRKAKPKGFKHHRKEVQKGS